jgi:hypothetical protein
MENYFLHLWSPPPETLQLTCPAPPPGAAPDPVGFFDPASVQAAYSLAGYVSVGLVVLLVLATYFLTTGSLSPRFVKRWWIFLSAAAVACFAAAFVILRGYPTHAMLGSCTTNPTAFAEQLPMDLVWLRSLAGLVWGALAFGLLSIVLTRTVGRWHGARGLFHFRGCPVPRFLP